MGLSGVSNMACMIVLSRLSNECRCLLRYHMHMKSIFNIWLQITQNLQLITRFYLLVGFRRFCFRKNQQSLCRLGSVLSEGDYNIMGFAGWNEFYHLSLVDIRSFLVTLILFTEMDANLICDCELLEHKIKMQIPYWIEHIL